MDRLTDYEYLDYGMANPCQACVTWKWPPTVRKINGYTAISMFLIAWFVFLCFIHAFACLNICIMYCVIYFSIYTIFNPNIAPPHTDFGSYSHYPTLHHHIYSYSHSMSQMLPSYKNQMSLMLPSPYLVKQTPTTPYYKVFLNSYHAQRCFIPHYLYFSHFACVTGFILKLKCFSSFLELISLGPNILGHKLLILLLHILRWIYMYLFNASYQTTLDTLPVHVYTLSSYVITPHFGLHKLFLHFMYILNPALAKRLIKRYTVSSIYWFTWVYFWCIKSSQFALKADDKSERYVVLEKSLVDCMLLTLFLLSILYRQLPWLVCMHLSPVKFTPWRLCYIWQTYTHSIYFPIILYIAMNLRLNACSKNIFLPVQTLNFCLYILQICTALRLKICDILYRIYLIIHLMLILLSWMIFNGYFPDTSTTNPQSYCIYMYIYYHHYYHHHLHLYIHKPTNPIYIHWPLSRSTLLLFTQIIFIVLIFFLPTTFTNGLDSDQTRHFCGADLDPILFENMIIQQQLLASPSIHAILPLILSTSTITIIIIIIIIIITYCYNFHMLYYLTVYSYPLLCCSLKLCLLYMLGIQYQSVQWI